MTQEQVPLLAVQQLQVKGMAKAVDLSLQADDIYMLFGSSGSGKSQFLKALADLIVHQGKVLLQGISQAEFTAPAWRAQVMYFAAETAWWADTVADHFVKPVEQSTLDEVGLQATHMHANPDDLSSGEKQRLALLRGLQRKPKVLLLDEITANLDPDSETLVEALVDSYARTNHAGVIWISHAPEQVKRLATQQLSFDDLVGHAARQNKPQHDAQPMPEQESSRHE